jgi:SAM-dependent methyltransferase
MSRDNREAVGRKVRSFYEGCSFPGYEEFETLQDLIDKSQRGIYAKLLDDQIPLGVRVLDAGCGTGQLAIFLSVLNRQVVGIDFSEASITKGNSFKRKVKLRNVQFARMDLFAVALKEESFDFVFCNGVLHHTADAYGAFQNLCRLVKPGGYITIGLYNTYGRLLLDLRRRIFACTNDKLNRLDFFMRQKSLGNEKKHIWFMDQYKHPHEDKFTVDDVLGWFQKNRIEYVNSIPKIRFGDRFSTSDDLFRVRSPGSRLEHLLCQLGWVFSQGKEGGFYITIGRRM